MKNAMYFAICTLALVAISAEATGVRTRTRTVTTSRSSHHNGFNGFGHNGYYHNNAVFGYSAGYVAPPVQLLTAPAPVDPCPAPVTNQLSRTTTRTTTNLVDMYNSAPRTILRSAPPPPVVDDPVPVAPSTCANSFSLAPAVGYSTGYSYNRSSSYAGAGSYGYSNGVTFRTRTFHNGYAAPAILSTRGFVFPARQIRVENRIRARNIKRGL